MPSERINNVRVNLEALSEMEARNLQGYLGERLIRSQFEYVLVDEMVQRRFGGEEA